MLVAVSAAVLAVVALVAVAPSAGAAGVVDHKRLAKQVATVVAPVYPDLHIAAVTCPKGIKRRAGAVAVCDVNAGPLSLEMKVTQTDRKGNVTVESTQAVIPKAAAEAFVRDNATLPAQVDCGPDPYLVRPPGTSFACTATFGDGTTQQVMVAVRDVAGNATITQVL